MIGTILLNSNENTQQVEEEEKYRFLKNLLEQMGVPINEFWTTDSPLSIPQKIQLRAILMQYGVQFIDSLDGECQVYVENEKVGSWEKPTYKIKRDLREIDPRKKLYLEMTVEFNSVFDEQE